MIARKFVPTAAFVLATIGASAVAKADELQNQVLAAARAARSDTHSFRRNLTIERTGAARKVFSEQYDPRRPAAQQWALVSVDGRAPTAQEIEQSRKAKRGPVPSYAQLADWFGAPASRSEHGPGYVLYRFARLPAGALKIGSHDASPDTQAEALVNTKGSQPYVEQIRFVSNKGFSMMLVASIKSMAITGRYRMLPDGLVVPADSSSDMAGSLLGKSGQMRTSATYSDFQKVR